MDDVLERIESMGVVPVVTIENTAHCRELGQALIDGGLPSVEVTFRTDMAADAIGELSSAHSGLLVGAGTVLTVLQAQTAISSGARFVMTPGFDHDVVDWCLDNQVPILPGVMTPTDINVARNKGLRVAKFFPAEASGGITALKAVSGPYSDMRFVPTGGINPDNLSDYLSLPVVLACGGTWVAKKADIANMDFDSITRTVRETVTIVMETRGKMGKSGG